MLNVSEIVKRNNDCYNQLQIKTPKTPKNPITLDSILTQLPDQADKKGFSLIFDQMKTSGVDMLENCESIDVKTDPVSHEREVTLKLPFNYQEYPDQLTDFFQYLSGGFAKVDIQQNGNGGVSVKLSSSYLRTCLRREHALQQVQQKLTMPELLGKADLQSLTQCEMWLEACRKLPGFQSLQMVACEPTVFEKREASGITVEQLASIKVKIAVDTIPASALLPLLKLRLELDKNLPSKNRVASVELSEDKEHVLMTLDCDPATVKVRQRFSGTTYHMNSAQLSGWGEILNRLDRAKLNPDCISGGGIVEDCEEYLVSRSPRYDGRVIKSNNEDLLCLTLRVMVNGRDPRSFHDMLETVFLYDLRVENPNLFKMPGLSHDKQSISVTFDPKKVEQIGEKVNACTAQLIQSTTTTTTTITL